MNKSIALILFLFTGATSHAVSIEWDRCAGVSAHNVWSEARTTSNRDDRAYRECRALYADRAANVKQYRCQNVASKNHYDFFVKGSGETLRVRESRNGIWMPSPFVMDVQGSTLKTSGFDRAGRLATHSVCKATN